MWTYRTCSLNWQSPRSLYPFTVQRPTAQTWDTAADLNATTEPTQLQVNIARHAREIKNVSSGQCTSFHSIPSPFSHQSVIYRDHHWYSYSVIVILFPSILIIMVVLVLWGQGCFPKQKRCLNCQQKSSSDGFVVEEEKKWYTSQRGYCSKCQIIRKENGVCWSVKLSVGLQNTWGLEMLYVKLIDPLPITGLSLDLVTFQA